MPDLDKLKPHVSKLHSLLSDSHPGLFTWSALVAEHWQAIAKMWNGELAPWSEDWPTEPGYYWFYGWCFRAWHGTRNEPPKLHFVQVRRIANGLALVTDGHFLYKAEGGEGLWAPATLPELPTQFARDRGKT